MKKESADWKRIVLNLFFILLAVIVFVLFSHITHGFFIIAVGISFVCLACPMMIRCASKVISDEKHKVDMQILYGLPIDFNKKKVLLSYVEIFVLLGAFSGIGFFLPDGLWILVFPPIGVIDFVILKLTEHTWLIFGWKKRLYWFWNGLTAGIIFLLIWIVRGCAMK